MTKKLLERAGFQGNVGHREMTIANSLDYKSWNNYQRKTALQPMFKVLGQAYGLENIFNRTHEIFENSLFYYSQFPEWYNVVGESIVPKPGFEDTAWEGQLGGVEGVRQKGWTLLSFLVIERAKLLYNTKIRVLAQGDNQVIFTNYKLQDYSDTKTKETHLYEVYNNNNKFMSEVERGTKKLGLTINQDETVSSQHFFSYGKIFVIGGHILGQDSKRVSRLTLSTNDQIPTFQSETLFARLRRYDNSPALLLLATIQKGGDWVFLFLE